MGLSFTIVEANVLCVGMMDKMFIIWYTNSGNSRTGMREAQVLFDDQKKQVRSYIVTYQ